ncbi:MAG TPA: hypothetical protein VMM15_01260, partial [Bradyrhizobium sp.]|nr:hypothetical protein [Bradyrhizobium sp.]
ILAGVRQVWIDRPGLLPIASPFLEIRKRKKTDRASRAAGPCTRDCPSGDERLKAICSAQNKWPRRLPGPLTAPLFFFGEV